MDLTLLQKQRLAAFGQSGKHVVYVTYNPNITDGDPSAEPVSRGYSEFSRTSSANLVQVILVFGTIPEEEFFILLDDDSFIALSDSEDELLLLLGRHRAW